MQNARIIKPTRTQAGVSPRKASGMLGFRFHDFRHDFGTPGPDFSVASRSFLYLRIG